MPRFAVIARSLPSGSRGINPVLPAGGTIARRCHGVFDGSSGAPDRLPFWRLLTTQPRRCNRPTGLDAARAVARSCLVFPALLSSLLSSSLPRQGLPGGARLSRLPSNRAGKGANLVSNERE